MKDPKPINPWSLSSEGLQLVITLLLAIFVGYQLDAYFHTGSVFLVGGAVLGIIAGLYNLLKRFL